MPARKRYVVEITMTEAEADITASALEHFIEYLQDFGGKDYDPEDVHGLIVTAEDALREVTTA